MSKIRFFNNYFLKENVLHIPGKCINKKAWVLPFNISSDYEETKCGKETKNMEYNSVFNDNVIFCKNCTI